MAVRIVTDSSCDLPDALATELDIEIVPLTIRFGDDEYVDRRDLTSEQFWAKMSESAFLPETSAPSAGAFEDVFRGLADDGADGILSVNLSSKLSGTLQAAQVGAKSVEGLCEIAAFDSELVSMGLGNLVLEAARLARKGAGIADITERLVDLRSRSRIYGALDTLENLKKGGRVGNAQALLGSMLSIKPVIEIRDGEVHPAARVRTRSKVLRWLVDRVKEEGTVENLAVVDGNAPDVQLLLDMLDPLYPADDIVVAQCGSVIGTHSGPGLIGVAYQRPR